MDIQTYRYLACGGTNVAMDVAMYFISYHFIFQKQIVYLPAGIAISPYIAAFLVSFFICFPLGFLLMRKVAFPKSSLRGRTQLLRYFAVVMLNLILNYVLLKILIEQFMIFPTPAKILTTLIIIVVSYLLQKNYTFKT
ncbi:MAG: GtrA family protein [Bacteroidetes bacterium]|nr:GtrA family protein [Bacteroidota bacterium]